MKHKQMGWNEISTCKDPQQLLPPNYADEVLTEFISCANAAASERNVQLTAAHILFRSVMYKLWGAWHRDDEEIHTDALLRYGTNLQWELMQREGIIKIRDAFTVENVFADTTDYRKLNLPAFERWWIEHGGGLRR